MVIFHSYVSLPEGTLYGSDSNHNWLPISPNGWGRLHGLLRLFGRVDPREDQALLSSG